MYEEFARYILLNLRGLEVVNAIDAMRQAREPLTLASMSRFLKNFGIYVPPTGTHLSKLHGWLTLARVFTRPGDFGSLDMERVRGLLGIGDAGDIDRLADMPEDQRAFLKALANLPMPSVPDTEPLLASQVVAYAAAMYGVQFEEKGLVKTTLAPLEAAGFVTLGKAPKATGDDAGSRPQISGKPTLVYRTEKFATEYLEPIIDALANTGLSVRHLIRLPLADILEEMRSPDRNVKGRALEALAFYFMRLLDLEFRAWRLRGRATGGAEVDVLVEGARLLFSRWQIQCKNTGVVALDDVAKEVGLSLRLRSNVILVVSSGRIAKDAQEYVDAMLEATNLNIITLDRSDLDRLAKNPLAIAPLLNDKARRVMEIKALDR